MRDFLPPFRPDVAVLFGRELLKLGVQSDLIGQRAARNEPCTWPAGRVWVRGREGSGALGELLRPFHDLLLLRHTGADHQLIQVRDKIRTALLVRAWAALHNKPWAYWMSFPIAEGHAQRAKEMPTGLRGVLLRLRAALAHRLFYHHVVPHARHIFVQSEAMLEAMVARGLPRERMSAVPMGVDFPLLAKVEPLDEPPAHWRGRRVVGYLGSLGRARDPEFLLSSLRLLRELEPTAMLLLVGDAPSEEERCWLRARIADSGLAEHVHLTGWLPQAEALRWLACAELAWSPVPRGPLFDVSSPTKAVEYLALGLPCVGNDIPDQQLVLTQSGGGICVPMEIEAFAHASMRLLDDPRAARTMASAGKSWVQQHRDYGVLALHVAAVYERLCSTSDQ